MTDKESKLVEEVKQKVQDLCDDGLEYSADYWLDVAIKLPIEAGRKAEREVKMDNILGGVIKQRAYQEGWNKCIEAVEKLATTKYEVGMYGSIRIQGKDWQALKKQKPPTKVRSKD